MANQVCCSLRREGSSALEILFHEDPAFNVLEINLLNDTESMWISDKASLEVSRALGQYTSVTHDAFSLFTLKSKFREHPNI